MPRKKFDKKSATTYQLLYREQNDPRLHDEGVSSMVLHAVQAPGRKGRNRTELEAELFGDDDSVAGVRSNEGEAAEHGVFFDDSAYDYMQHLRDLGGSDGVSGQSVWLEAPAQGKGKKKVELDEVLQRLDLGDASGATKVKITDASILPSSQLRKTTYQDQQDVPDALAGFQPDMDSRLREVLEALDDDAYVDADAKDDSFFSSIAEGGEELSLADFRQTDDDDDEEDWESDDTAKPRYEYQDAAPADADIETKLAMETAEDHGDGEFMANFRSLPKSSRKAKANAPGSLLTASSALTAGGKHKKRKGALTSSDNYSMTSSSLARTDALNTLDARFEKTLETYMEDEEDEGFADDDMSLVSGRVSNISGVSGLSKASTSSRASQASSLADNHKFNSIMDEFLGEYSHTGKRRVVKGKPQSGMQQLDEIRKNLGPARHAATKVGPP